MVAALFQPLAQGPEIVNFPILDRANTRILVEDGLATAPYVDDRKSTIPETNALAYVDPFIVRSPVLQDRTHSLQLLPRWRSRPPQGGDSSDPTHQSIPNINHLQQPAYLANVRIRPILGFVEMPCVLGFQPRNLRLIKRLTYGIPERNRVRLREKSDFFAQYLRVRFDAGCNDWYPTC
jgi:hypothetical protein